MSEEAQRANVVAIAESWLRTPYHHLGRVKGVGVDCGTLLVEVFVEAGLITDFEVPYYPQDFNLNRGEEFYLQTIERFARQISDEPKPGDVAVWKFGRCFSHAAIVKEWPMVIHAYRGRTVSIEDAVSASWLNVMTEDRSNSWRPRRFYSYWAPPA